MKKTFQIQKKTALEGAIYNTGYIQTIDNAYFKDNSANANNVAQGAAIYNLTTTIKEIKNTTFENNNTQGGTWSEGSAIWNGTYASIEDLQANFKNNKAGNETAQNANGGAIYNIHQALYKIWRRNAKKME